MDFVLPLKILSYFNVPNIEIIQVNNHTINDIKYSINNMLIEIKYIPETQNINDIKLIIAVLLKVPNYITLNLYTNCSKIGKAFFAGYVNDIILITTCVQSERMEMLHPSQWVNIINNILWGIALSGNIETLKIILKIIAESNNNLETIYWNYTQNAIDYAIFNDKEKIIKCVIDSTPNEIPKYYMLFYRSYNYSKHDASKHYLTLFDAKDYCHLIPYLINKDMDNLLNICMQKLKECENDIYIETIIARICGISAQKNRLDIIKNVEHMVTSQIRWVFILNTLKEKIINPEIITYLETKLNDPKDYF